MTVINKMVTVVNINIIIITTTTAAATTTATTTIFTAIIVTTIPTIIQSTMFNRGAGCAGASIKTDHISSASRANPVRQ